jgi:hypothetical protein
LALESRRVATGEMALLPFSAVSGPIESTIALCADQQSQGGISASCTASATLAHRGINLHSLGRRDDVRAYLTPATSSVSSDDSDR